MTSGSGVPLLVACSGWASKARKPSASPSSSLSLIGCTHRSKRDSDGATIEATIASSELSRIGLIEPALWIFHDVPCIPKHERKVFTSEAGVGASPTIASRAPWPFRPEACSGAIPWAARIWFGYRPLDDVSAAGNDCGTQPNAGDPV